MNHSRVHLFRFLIALKMLGHHCTWHNQHLTTAKTRVFGRAPFNPLSYYWGRFNHQLINSGHAIPFRFLKFACITCLYNCERAFSGQGQCYINCLTWPSKCSVQYTYLTLAVGRQLLLRLYTIWSVVRETDVQNTCQKYKITNLL